jgi:uncharacterized membrane protein YqjE
MLTQDDLKGEAASRNADGTAADLRGLGSAPLRGVLEEASRVVGAVRETVSSFLELVTLEAHRAGAALVWMIAFGVVAGVCVIATWLGLMAALAMWVTSAGLSPILAVLLVALLNLALAGALAYAGIRKTDSLTFPATRRQLSGHREAKAST